MGGHQESGPILPQFPPIAKWSGGQVALGSPQIRALSTTSATTEATLEESGGFAFGILRFSRTGHPEALVACYVASWQLPRLDFRQLADDSFRTHQSELLGGSTFSTLDSLPVQPECYATKCKIRDQRKDGHEV
jgi:hypothetical protein